MSSSITGSKSNIGGMLSSRTGRLGVQLTRQGSAMSSEVDGITKNLLKIISIDPQYSGAYRLLGEILLTKKDYDKAIENLKKALLLNKNDCEALNLLGKVIQASGKADTAI
jgi:Tfp pilus assembly protein PilF